MSNHESPIESDKSPWWWHPPLPIEDSPLFTWPPRPLQSVNAVLGKGFLWSPQMLYVGLAILTWLHFSRDLERCVEFRVGWIAELYVFNLISVIVIAGGLHLYLYTFKRQGMEQRMDPSEQGRNNPKFFTGNQVWDNIFYTCVSGVTIWSAYTVVFIWAYANHFIPWLAWSASPLDVVWFLALFPLLVLWQSVHFYLGHRLLHSKFCYRRWHEVHHRNINTGPWSGFSMHPVEHVFYFSSILIHLVVASHPVHMLFHMYYTALDAVTSHSGYGDLLVKGKGVVRLGSFYHQLHHRYFNCNYGASFLPLDKFFGSFHDGTPEAAARVREYQLRKRGGRFRTSPSPSGRGTR
jgi:lathosterol oxidase